MGGADRSERRRKQEAAQARLKAAGITPKRSGPSGNALVLGIVAVVVIVAIIVGVVVTLNSRSTTEAVAPNYPVARDGAAITAGQAAAPVTVDIYEDYLCPYCERLETAYKDQITTALNAGQIKVNYHAISILDRASSPAGYSTRAANAAICAADAGIFPAYHAALYADQPAEGSAGFSVQELTDKGTALGAGAGFGQCVAAQANTGLIENATNTAAANPALQTNGNFGTPTVAVGGQKVDVNDSEWLQKAIVG
ncbi:DsbA family protein [Pseudonocardia xishanensis]|uniref:Thioredoxin domain-containing protein n=1 Tax=Pseudonocardia xishanensis TaxID=630995 RepID=A0ABP8S4A8_9PSEU